MKLCANKCCCQGAISPWSATANLADNQRPTPRSTAKVMHGEFWMDGFAGRSCPMSQGQFAADICKAKGDGGVHV